MKIGFVGAGVVATALAVALSRRGYDIPVVASRHRDSAARLAARLPACVPESAQAVADLADLVFITTPDDAIAGVADEVRWRPGQAVIHCSGAASTEILWPARAAGAAVGAFHPLQSFASVEQAIESLPGTTFATEADEPLLSRLVEIATALGGAVVRLRPEDKVLYHASAVLVSNYLVTLVKLATDLWSSFGVDRSTATQALLPLLRGTLGNLERVGLPDCLTGPIARGDLGTVRRHLSALSVGPAGIAETYRLLGIDTIPLAAEKGSLTPERARELLGLLDGQHSALP